MAFNAVILKVTAFQELVIDFKDCDITTLLRVYRNFSIHFKLPVKIYYDIFQYIPTIPLKYY